MLKKRLLHFTTTWAEANNCAVNAKRVIGVLLYLTASTMPTTAQPTGLLSGNPVVQRRCTTVVVRSENPWLPRRLIEPYLQRRWDFEASKFVLTQEEGSADVVVNLRPSGQAGTYISILSSITGQRRLTMSTWTNYPGMIALDITEQLRLVCPGSFVPRAEYRRARAECHPPAVELRSVATIAGCSHTSWMEDRDIYHALHSRTELKQWSVQVLPECERSDFFVDISHNLDLTVEWFWTLRPHQGAPIVRGHVIAFDKGNAAAKIARAVAVEIALAHGADVEANEFRKAARKPMGGSGWSGRAQLIPTDFSMPDTSTSLYIDNEHMIARDINNRVIIAASPKDVLDVRLRSDWRRSLQLDDPGPMLKQVLNDAVVTSDDLAEVAGQEGVPSSSSLRLIRDTGKTAVRFAGLITYMSMGTVLAQIPTRSEVLDIAWEQDGDVKTVSLQVPMDESHQVLHALRALSGGEKHARNCVALSEGSQR